MSAFLFDLNINYKASKKLSNVFYLRVSIIYHL
nr:MAG TPA: hypothetical protein [Caudoviricetes sp.]